MPPYDVPVAQTSFGAVKGRACSKPNGKNAKQVYRFSGIPFAKPPVGELRFEPPQKWTEKWDKPMDGTKLKASPVQAIEMAQAMDPYFVYPNEFDEDFEEIDEDCLYLKVYTSNPSADAKLPVMFWIYGGGFQMGGTSIYDGNVLASLHDVIVVMPNYRVNAFGYMSFKPGETTCNGNMGMLDQVCALEWVQENIEGFGGDPNNVTIFGESAGAGSVVLHVESAVSSKLFHKAIAHSAVPGGVMVVDKHNDSGREALLEALKIEDKDPKEQLKKLKQLPADEINKVAGEMMMNMKYFSVSMDGTFVSDHPDEVLEKKSFNRVPFIVGVNSTEEFGILAPGQEKGFSEGLSADDAKQSLKSFFQYAYPPSNDDRVFNEIWKKYEEIYPDTKDKLRYSRMAGEMAGDVFFNVESRKLARSYVGTGEPTYFYFMNQKLRFNHEKAFQPAKDAQFKSEMCECDHGDDLVFTFGLPHTNAKLSLDIKFSDEERKLSLEWMGYLTNFATTGNPNEGAYKPAVEWEQFGSKERHLVVNGSPKMKNNDFEERYKFWQVHLKNVAKSSTKF